MIPGDLKLTEHVPTPSLTPEMKPAEALLLAIKREEQAIKDYSVLAQLSKRDEEKALFERLALAGARPQGSSGENIPKTVCVRCF